MTKHKKRILIITGTRADYGLLKPTIQKAAKSKLIHPVLLVTGMHTLKKFGHTLHEIQEDNFPVGVVVKISPKDDMLTSLSKEIMGIREYCTHHPVDGMLLLGDRDEMFAGAIVAGHLKIPIAHIHGGDISGYGVDEPIRYSITKFAHLHFPVTKKSQNRLLKLGEEKWRVIRIGSPGTEGIEKIKLLSKTALAKKFGLDLNKKWNLVLHHPTPLDSTTIKNQIRPLFSVLSEQDAEKIIIYPNSDTGNKEFIKTINTYKDRGDFHIFENISHAFYLNFLACSNLLIGNSSSGLIETPHFRIPAISIGNRQLGREKSANVIDCNYSAMSIRAALREAESKSFARKCRDAKNPYQGPAASTTIIKTIEKYINNKQLFYKKNTHA